MFAESAQFCRDALFLISFLWARLALRRSSEMECMHQIRAVRIVQYVMAGEILFILVDKTREKHLSDPCTPRLAMARLWSWRIGQRKPLA